MSAPKKSVVLLSGGLDSAANLALAVEQDDVLLALNVDYGQRAAVREFEAASRFCEYYKVSLKHLDLKWLGQLKKSALTDRDLRMPELDESELDHAEKTAASALRVWVPNRNGVFLNVAAAFAETLGAEQVVVGFNREEAVTFPDNSIPFMEAISKSLSYSTALAEKSVRVWSYTAHLNKTEIVENLKSPQRKQSFRFDWVWSCYQGGDQPCGVCESCLRFKRGLG